VLLIIGTIVAFTFLDWPWRIGVIAALAAIESLEIMLWLRLRRLRAMTGSEALVGTRGKAVTDCDPVGQVRVRGAIWKARSSGAVAAGDDVEVTSVDGLELQIRRASAPVA
jgi:membrane protein implicated in regulation of membrane protease activity